MIPDWTTACPDWANRLKTGRTIIPPPIFPERAEEALKVFKSLRIVDAPGSPTFGEACAQWVFDFVASVFGSYDATTGRRLITEWFLLIPKKNSKSTIAAGIQITAVILNWRLSAEYQIIAPTVKVANNSYAPASDMVSRRADAELATIFHARDHTKTIEHRTTKATLAVLAAESDTVGGSKGVGTLIDELWLFGKRPNAKAMLVEAKGGLTSRPEGFVIYSTTQSDDAPAGVFKEKLEYARKVRDGEIVDKQFVPILFEFPQEMIKRGEHLDPANFGMVNPNLNYSVDREYLERELKLAQEGEADSLRNFLAKHLNVQVGLNLHNDRWPGAEYWEAAVDPTLTLDTLLARSEVVTVGIDGGGLDDLLGLCVMGRDRDTRKWLVWCHAWAHEIVLERRKEIAPRLQDFAKAGELTIVKRPGEDVTELADIVCGIKDMGLLPAKAAIGVDTAGIGDVVDELTAEGRGIPIDAIIGVSQGWRLNGAIKTTERKLAGDGMLVAPSGLMPWCVGNAKVVPSGNAELITKQVSGKAKIDPLMAVFDASTLMATNPAPMNKKLVLAVA